MPARFVAQNKTFFLAVWWETTGEYLSEIVWTRYVRFLEKNGYQFFPVLKWRIVLCFNFFLKNELYWKIEFFWVQNCLNFFNEVFSKLLIFKKSNTRCRHRARVLVQSHFRTSRRHTICFLKLKKKKYESEYESKKRYSAFVL